MNKRNNRALAQLEPLRHKPTTTIGKVSRDEIKNMMTPEMSSQKAMHLLQNGVRGKNQRQLKPL